MENTFLIITSIANQDHPVLQQFAIESEAHHVTFIVIGDTKSPEEFHLEGCDFYSVERQKKLKFELVENLPLCPKKLRLFNSNEQRCRNYYRN